MEVPDRSRCWECTGSGVPANSENSTQIPLAKVQHWIRTPDRDGNWLGDEDDGQPHTPMT